METPMCVTPCVIPISCDTLSRWKGMETFGQSPQFPVRLKVTLDTLSRLKGMETAKRHKLE